MKKATFELAVGDIIDPGNNERYRVVAVDETLRVVKAINCASYRLRTFIPRQSWEVIEDWNEK